MPASAVRPTRSKSAPVSLPATTSWYSGLFDVPTLITEAETAAPASDVIAAAMSFKDEPSATETV